MAIKAFVPVFSYVGSQTEPSLSGFLIATISLDGFFGQFMSDAFVDTTLSVRIYDGNTLVFASGAAQEMSSRTSSPSPIGSGA